MSRPAVLSALPGREIGLVACVAVALYLLLALGSYSPMDPAVTFAGTDLAVSNLVGRSGALAADVMFLAFGWAAHLLPAGLALCGAMLLRRGLPDLRSWPEGLIRVGGFVAVLVSTCVLTRLHAADDGGLPAGPGGAVGASIVAVGLPVLNWVGLTLCAVAALLVGSQAALRYSWLHVVEQIGRGIEAFARRLVALAVVAHRRSGLVVKLPSVAPFARRRAPEVEAPQPEPALVSLPIVEAAPEPVVPARKDERVRKEPTVAGRGRPSAKTQRLEPTVGLVREPVVDPLPAAAVEEPGEPLMVRPSESSPVEEAPPALREGAVDEAQPTLPEDAVDEAPPALREGAVQEPQPPFEDPTVEETRIAASAVPLAVEDPPPAPIAAPQEPPPAPVVVSEEPPPAPVAAPAPVPVASEVQATAPRAIDVRKRPIAGESPVTELPDLGLLEDYDRLASGGYSKELLEDLSRLLEERLADFRVEARVVSALPGPVVTRFELELAKGTRVSKISALAKDLARSLAVVSVRIVEVIPGKSVVGIEIPNEQRETVRLKEILDAPLVRRSKSPLTLALGKDIAGVPVMADIGKMPHLLVAGTTGSGKSVSINAMLLSMLYKATPDELRLILVDPKMLELAVYDDIPHLLTPVVTDMKDAAQALNWCVAEMERRYRLMAALGVRNLGGYNKRIVEAESSGEAIPDPLWPDEAGGQPPALEHLPFIVVVIDEFADMMMVVGKKVEQLIARIAQKARAAGIHLLLATQRPSADVITGLIKANIPARVAFQVSSDGNSRIILDQGGAEHLLGHGDMLFLQPGTSMPTRVHGAFVSDEEVHAVAADWKSRGEPDYIANLLDGAPPDAEVPGTVDFGDGDTESKEPLYDEAVAFVLHSRRASISAVQRKLRIGYNRAARLIEAMEQAGVVSPMNSNGGRDVLVPKRTDDAA